jgi:RNA polymerase sigma factor (sigma-70 family)
MQTPATSGSRPKRPFMVAMVLGTALSALAPGQHGRAETRPETLRAIDDMGRYCTACWRNARLPADAWTDCTQEVFSRLLERIPTEQWDRVLRADADEHREFVRAIDAVKKRTQRARKWTAGLDGVADPRDDAARDLHEEREVVRQAAAEVLTRRQQRILQLGFEGWSVHETAAELRLPPERVSDEKYKAIRKLRAHLADHCS